MKVEIDADELCELRRRANKQKLFLIQGEFGEDFGELLSHVEDLERENEQLKDERDWWRGWAVAICGMYRNPTILLTLKLDAEKHGYEVPE